MNDPLMTVSDAFLYCKRIGTNHYENFPVGSFLLPKASRTYFYALYAFMRTADDFADLPASGTSNERVEKLRQWRQYLENIYNNIPPTHPVFIALAETIHKYKFEKELFIRLLDAFEFDAKANVRIDSYHDILIYTNLSANPVGELVLGLFGYKNKELINLSDWICSGLQYINFIQDLKEDSLNDRFYLPLGQIAADSIHSFGTNNEINRKDFFKRSSPQLCIIVLQETLRAEEWITKGAPLAELVRGRLRLELRAVIFGARRIIRKIRKHNGDVFTHRPKLSKLEHVYILLKSLIVKAA